MLDKVSPRVLGSPLGYTVPSPGPELGSSGGEVRRGSPPLTATNGHRVPKDGETHVQLCNLMDCSTQASLSFTISWSLLKFMPIESVKLHNHLISPFLSCPQSFPALGSFPRSRHFASGGQSMGALASASVLAVDIQS